MLKTNFGVAFLPFFHLIDRCLVYLFIYLFIYYAYFHAII